MRRGAVCALALLALGAVGQELDWHAGASSARRLELLDSCAVMSGDVRLRYRNLELEASAVAVWADPDSLVAAISAWGGSDPDDSVRRRGVLRERLTLELYAEGSVVLRWSQNSLSARAVFLDFRTGRGSAEDVVVRISNPAQALPFGQAQLSGSYSGSFQFRAPRLEFAFAGLENLEQLQQVFASQRFEPEDLRLVDARGDSLLATTCLHEVPHYGVFVETGRVSPIEGEPGVYALTGSGLRPRFSLPVTAALAAEFSLPGLHWIPLWWRSDLPFPLSVSIGSSREFGTAVETTIRVPFLPAKTKLTLEADYYSRRGMGYGLELSTRQPGHSLEVEGYSINDRASDGNGFEPPREHRGRLRARDVFELPFGVRQELQLNYISDRGFLEEYFERENQEDKAPESLLHYRWARESFAAALLGRLRLNRFQTQTEYRPALSAVLVPEHLFDVPGLDAGIYLSARGELAEVWRSFDSELDLPSYRAERGDLQVGLDAPFSLGDFVFRPEARARFTAWNADVRTQRVALEAGGEVGTFLARSFAFRWDLLDIHGLRHSVFPVLGYSNRFHVNRPPEELLFFDSTEELERVEFFRWKLRQRLQTRSLPRRRLKLRVKDGAPRMSASLQAEWLRAYPWLLELEVQPDGLLVELQAETPLSLLSQALEEVGLVLLEVEELESPSLSRDLVEWRLEQDFFPDPRRDNQGKAWGPIRSELRLPLTYALSAYLRTRHDPLGDLWLSTNLGVDYWLENSLRITVDHGYVSDRASASNMFASFWLSERWQGQVGGRYNWNEERLDEHNYTLRRIFDEFYLDFKLSLDRGDDDISFRVEFGLTDLLFDDDDFRLSSGERALEYREER